MFSPCAVSGFSLPTAVVSHRGGVTCGRGPVDFRGRRGGHGRLRPPLAPVSKGVVRWRGIGRGGLSRGLSGSTPPPAEWSTFHPLLIAGPREFFLRLPMCGNSHDRKSGTGNSQRWCPSIGFDKVKMLLMGFRCGRGRVEGKAKIKKSEAKNPIFSFTNGQMFRSAV